MVREKFRLWKPACVVVAVAGLLVTACGNPGLEESTEETQGEAPDPNRPRPRPTQDPREAPWIELWQQVTSCKNSKCPSEKGFGVLAGGKFYVGPTLERATNQGTISLAEEESLSNAAEAVAAQGITAAPARCSTVDSPPGAISELVLKMSVTGGQAPIVVYEVSQRGKRICVRGDIDKAQSLRDSFSPIIANYDQPLEPSPRPSGSPNPFPWPFPWP